jgi:cysteine-rich repeat protein
MQGRRAHAVHVQPEPRLQGRLGRCVLGAYCGDGIKQEGEHCDDGNRIDGDGCNSSCRKLVVK